MTLRAIAFSERDEFREKRLPGSINVGPIDQDAEGALWFFCPCGCDALCCIPIAVGHKPSDSPSWMYNGKEAAPTLTPSVHQLNCGWHGWLRNGYWEDC